MAQKQLTKKEIPPQRQQEVRRDLKAWRGFMGMWRGKKGPDPVKWQREIRKEADRRLP